METPIECTYKQYHAYMSLLLLEVELMETIDIDDRVLSITSILSVASIIRSGINGNGNCRRNSAME